MFEIEFPTLYKRTSSGRIQQWTIFVRNGSWWTLAGMHNGTLTKSEKTICVGKNIGRSNETSPKKQAAREARSKYNKKMESGWVRDISTVDQAISFLEPMLARNYKDLKKPLPFPIYSQPKLDGIRCIANKDGLWSRGGKRFNSCPHIEIQLREFFRAHPLMILDGEFYNHEFKSDFNSIVSLIKTSKPTKEHFRKTSDLVEYHVFDILGKNIIGKDEGARDFPFRLIRLEEYAKHFFKDMIVTVSTVPCGNKKEIDKQYGEYLEEGYEGQMIRLEGPYEPKKRSQFLLKRKEHIDDEFEIIKVTEGKGKRAGMVGRFYVKDKKGVISKVNPKGSVALYTEWWKNKKSLIGKQATVRFQNYTPDGKIRFGRMLAIRDYE